MKENLGGTSLPSHRCARTVKHSWWRMAPQADVEAGIMGVCFTAVVRVEPRHAPKTGRHCRPCRCRWTLSLGFKLRARAGQRTWDEVPPGRCSVDGVTRPSMAADFWLGPSNWPTPVTEKRPPWPQRCDVPRRPGRGKKARLHGRGART